MGIKTKIIKVGIYVIFPITIYFLTKHFFPTPEDEKQRNSKNREIPGIIKDPDPLYLTNPIKIRGGFLSRFSNIISETTKTISENRYILACIVALCGVAIADNFKSVWREIITGASPAIAALPAPLIRELLKGFETLSTKELLNRLRKGLTSKELSTEEKMGLLKRTVGGLLTIVTTTPARRRILLSVLFTILAVTMQSGGLFGSAILCLQEILSKAGLKKSAVEYIISIYQEYNAPIPADLAKLAIENGVF